MAARYWVGGTGNWDTTTTHWSETSGGAGCATVPTSSDDVYFNENSGGGVVTVYAGKNAKDLNTTGFNGTISGSTLFIFGNVVIASETNFALTNQLTFRASGTLLVDQASLSCSVNISPANGNIVVDLLSDITFAFGKNLKVSGTSAKSATFNTNNHNLTFSGDALSIQAGLSTYVGIINFGSSIISTESSVPFIKGANGVINTQTSKIEFRNVINTITLPNIQYYDIEFVGENAVIESLDATINCNSIIFKAGSSFAVNGESVAGLTITANTVDAVGASGSLITLSGFSTDKKLTFSVPSGTVNCDYLSLTNSTATGGATFVAGEHSVDNGGNTGWFPSSGYSNTVMGIPGANIASIAGVSIANIAKVGGV